MPVKTLIVDDSESFRALLRRRLETLGCWIVGEASGAREGLEIFHSEHPSLVTLDLMMPDEASFTAKDLFRSIRQENPDTVIVVISVGPRVPTASPFLTDGATAYLEKTGLNFDELQRKLARSFPELDARRARVGG